MATISACLIVKDEERFLPRCLESIRGVVDEIVVVDTGSRDRTPEIARRFGAKVFLHPWRGDFSEARNVSLAKATGDWVLVIDADEELEVDDAPLLRQLATSRAPYDVIVMAIYNDLPGGRVAKHYSPRAFRRGRARYEGIVHNQLVYEGEPLLSEVRIRHHGYALGPAEMARKHERTRRLLERQIALDPSNTFARMNLVRVLRNLGRWQEAVAEAERALDMLPPLPQRLMLLYDLAWCLKELGRLEEAEMRCREGLRESPEDMNLLWTLAEVRMRRGRWLEAIEPLRELVGVGHRESVRPRYTPLIVDVYGQLDQAWYNLGRCYLWVGLLGEAAGAFRRALDLRDRPLYRRALEHCYRLQRSLKFLPHRPMHTAEGKGRSRVAAV